MEKNSSTPVPSSTRTRACVRIAIAPDKTQKRHLTCTCLPAAHHRIPSHQLIPHTLRMYVSVDIVYFLLQQPFRPKSRWFQNNNVANAPCAPPPPKKTTIFSTFVIYTQESPRHKRSLLACSSHHPPSLTLTPNTARRLEKLGCKRATPAWSVQHPTFSVQA